MNRNSSGRHPAYSSIWEFHVRRECEAEFEKLYGPAGEWARLFEKGEGYLGTELWRDVRVGGRYVTIDYWSSQDAYGAFRERFREAYERLDEHCERLTERELPLGEFSSGPISD